VITDKLLLKSSTLAHKHLHLSHPLEISEIHEHLVQGVWWKLGRWEAVINLIGIVAPPARERLVRQVDAQHLHRLHQLRTAIKTDSEQVFILAPPNRMPSIHIPMKVRLKSMLVSKLADWFVGKWEPRRTAGP